MNKSNLYIDIYCTDSDDAECKGFDNSGLSKGYIGLCNYSKARIDDDKEDCTNYSLKKEFMEKMIQTFADIYDINLEDLC